MIRFSHEANSWQFHGISVRANYSEVWISIHYKYARYLAIKGHKIVLD